MMDQAIPKTNQRQVGGDHYKAAFQHWDWAEAVGLGCLEYGATKYILPNRRAKKGGIDDLKKAIHFIEKLIEVGRPNRVYFKDPGDIAVKGVLFQEAILLTNKMCDQAGCSPFERDIILAIMCWDQAGDLNTVRTMIEDLMDVTYGEPE